MLFIKYSKIGINIYALVITIILSVLINQLIIRIDKSKSERESVNRNSKENVYTVKSDEEILKNTTSNEILQDIIQKETIENINIEETIDNNLWQIEIPKINLIAPIAEGTTVEVLNSYVGHFEETSNLEGNIGLAAHNRGYQVNYFQNLRELNVEDVIIYNYYGELKQYKISLVTIIKDTDWSYLQETEDNRITLITCVEDMPELRRCIQGIEKIN